MVSISAGRAHSLALLSDGSVLSWGAAQSGQLGLGDTVEQHGALQVNTAVSNIIFHSNALLDQVNELRLAFLAQHSNGNEDMEIEEENR